MDLTKYDKVMVRLEEMKPRYKEGFSSSDRELLEALNVKLFHKVITLTGCSDCYRDAYVIIYNKLKRDKTMPKQSEYCLKAGVVVHAFGSADYYTLSIPNEVAEDYLRKDPANIRDFQRFPENWKSRISKTQKKAAAPKKEDTASVESQVATEPAPEAEEIEKENKRK